MNTRAFALVGVALLALSLTSLTAVAQVMHAEPSRGFETSPGVMPGRVSITIVTNGTSMQSGAPFLVAGVDTLVNVTVQNGLKRWVNDTLTLENLTENVAVTLPDPVQVNVPPRGVASFALPVHVPDVGAVGLAAGLSETVSDGNPVRTQSSFLVTPPVSVRVISPTPAPQDPEFERVREHGPEWEADAPATTVRMDQTVAPVVRVENLLDTGVSGFTLRLRASHGGASTGDVDVPPLDARETRDIALPEWSPRDTFSPNAYYSRAQRVTFTILTTYDFGDASGDATAAAFRVTDGAVRTMDPAIIPVDVVGDVTVDVGVTRGVQLGVPARVRLNVTNHGTSTAESVRAIVELNTPGGADFVVQGPQSFSVDFGDVPPGAGGTRVFEWTPRVTGGWDLGYRVNWNNMGTGSSGHTFRVPVTAIAVVTDSALTGQARMGERVDYHIAVHTIDRLDDAELRIASTTGSRPYMDHVPATTGPRFQGLVNGVVSADPEVVKLGTLNAGSTMNATVSVVARGSGQYTLIPFVLADGFAYTGYATDLDADAPSGTSTLRVTVASRVLPMGLVLAPFTVTLGVTVGAWVLRTRFVK